MEPRTGTAAAGEAAPLRRRGPRWDLMLPLLYAPALPLIRQALRKVSAAPHYARARRRCASNSGSPAQQR